MSKEIFIDVLGWIGSAMVVAAYALNMYKKMSADALNYYLLNIFGSVLLVINTIYHQAIPSAVVNVIWIAIALIAIFKKKPNRP